ncbi:TatD family hydrolase [Pantoea sp.]|uniref:TatD family hydrolase n=1 Tax=Pantoea sp. TaxID=69393 RepID=UPI00289C93B8|nr:TatD family hydrolase [Pantoea sp.]
MKFIDTHCHFDFPPFTGDEQNSIVRAAEAGVEKLIVPAVDAGGFRHLLGLAETHPAIYIALGLHPIVIEQHQEAHLEALEAELKRRPAKLVAIGEIGLDLYRDDPHFDKQERLLDVQLKLARDYDLPAILHSRRTHDKLALHLRRHDLPRRGVVHGFAGSLQQAQAFIKLGYFIGIGGTITYERASKTRNTIAQLPLDALLLETDAPDMPLHGYQGQPNRPERARLVWQALCELRDEAPQAIAEALYANTRRLFQF